MEFSEKKPRTQEILQQDILFLLSCTQPVMLGAHHFLQLEGNLPWKKKVVSKLVEGGKQVNENSTPRELAQAFWSLGKIEDDLNIPPKDLEKDFDWSSFPN